jgi:hypothetical protein
MNLTYVTGAGTPADAGAVQEFLQGMLGVSVKELDDLVVTINQKTKPDEKQ